MEPTAFESWALTRCIPLGWKVSRTPRSYDGGADGILVHRESGALVIVQCKHRQGSDSVCGAEAIDELLRAREAYGAPNSRLFVLTNAQRFSQGAEERAQRFGVELISRQALAVWPRQLTS